MNQISEDREKLRNVLISKLGLPADRFQRDNQIEEAVGKLLHERGELLDFYRKLGNHLKLPTVRLDSDFFHMVDRLRGERDEAVSQISEITKMLVESSMMRRNIDSSIQALIEIATAPDATQPQLNEIRYVLHGDIQPCTVLYSDDTTTLLRLDEGDVMCETDTIEWSDSVTYRCQELLRGEAKRSNIPVTLSPVKLLAQLVRDERILLNDDALEETGGVVTLKAGSDIGIGQPVVQVRNPDDDALGVVSSERHAPTGDEPCVECNLPFDKNAVTCPVCNTIRPTEPAPQER